MKPQPFYTLSNCDPPAYSLRYIWTGWPSQNTFPVQPDKEFFASLDEKWEADGIRRLETEWRNDQIKIMFSVKPNISPVFFVSRVKGRLQHSLRTCGTPTKFSRKVSFSTVGENSTEQVENYIKQQVSKERFVDSRFAERISEFTKSDRNTELSIPTQSHSGRYWYNLHVVLVTHERAKIIDQNQLSAISNQLNRIAEKKGHTISIYSLMPDHLHMALRGKIESSPEDIALSFMNNTAYLIGIPIWRPSFYAGTFGEYDMGAIRARIKSA